MLSLSNGPSNLSEHAIHLQKIENLLSLSPWANWDVTLVSEEVISQVINDTLNYLKNNDDDISLKISLFKLLHRVSEEEFISSELKKTVQKINKQNKIIINFNSKDTIYSSFEIQNGDKFFKSLTLNFRKDLPRNLPSRTYFSPEVGSFLEYSSKYTTKSFLKIDKKTAQHIREVFSLDLPHLNTPPPSLRFLRDEYNKLSHIMSEHLSKAQASGKKVLINVGDAHDNKASLWWGCMLLDIANKMGVKNALLEANAERLSDFNISFDSVNLDYFTYYANHLGMNIIAGDPLHEIKWVNFDDKEFEDSLKRNDAINKNILALDQDAIFIVGFTHLRHISEDENLQNKYEILNINASNFTVFNDYMASRPLSIFPVDGDFCVDKENAIQLSFKGNAYDFDFASIKVLKETIEKISDKKISDKMISQKKTSQKKSSRKK